MVDYGSWIMRLRPVYEDMGFGTFVIFTWDTFFL